MCELVTGQIHSLALVLSCGSQVSGSWSKVRGDAHITVGNLRPEAEAERVAPVIIIKYNIIIQ